MESYFVISDSELVFRLNTRNSKRLFKQVPEWNKLNPSVDFEKVLFVKEFFKKNGTLVASPYFKNVFVGRIDE